MVIERILPGRRAAVPFPTEGGAVAPFQFPLDGNEYLRASMLSAVAGAAVSIQGRLLRPTGEIANFAFTLRGSLEMLMVEDEYQLGEGALLSVFAQPSTLSGSGTWGDTYVTLNIVRGLGPNAVELGVLIQSYVSHKQPAVWPGTPIRSSVDGYGRPYQFTVTNPAPGAAAAFTGGSGKRLRISTVQAALTADATAGNRLVNLRLLRSGVQVSRFYAAAPHAPSTEVTYYFVAGGASYAAAAGLVQFVPIPRALWFDDVDQIQVNSVGTIGAADQYFAVVVDAERWLVLPGVGLL